LLAAAAALLTLAACSDTTTAPRRLQPSEPRAEMYPGPGGTCNSGYHVATRYDGVQVCEPD
jgi:hypothetical protein